MDRRSHVRQMEPSNEPRRTPRRTAEGTAEALRPSSRFSSRHGPRAHSSCTLHFKSNANKHQPGTAASHLPHWQYNCLHRMNGGPSETHDQIPVRRVAVSPPGRRFTVFRRRPVEGSAQSGLVAKPRAGYQLRTRDHLAVAGRPLFIDSHAGRGTRCSWERAGQTPPAVALYDLDGPTGPGKWDSCDERKTAASVRFIPRVIPWCWPFRGEGFFFFPRLGECIHSAARVDSSPGSSSLEDSHHADRACRRRVCNPIRYA